MAWMNRLANLFRRRDLNPEIDEELQFHVDSRIRDNLAEGMTADEAKRDALRRFGNRAAVREQTRDTHVLVTLESIGQDLRFAARSLARRPGFTTVALVTLALGIGANASVFTIVRSVLLRPLSFPQSDRLQIVSFAPATGRVWLFPGLPDADYLAFREYDRSFEAIATFSSVPLTLTSGGDAVRVSAATVTADFFRVLRVNPVAGRMFAEDDVREGSQRVVLISESLWRSRFGGDAALITRRITLDGVEHTVVGILPPGFSYPGRTEVWTPLTVQTIPNLSLSRPVIGRLRAGTSREQAQAAFESFIRARHANSGSPWVAQVVPLKDAVVGDLGTPLLVFSGAVALVLLIACGNVANLLLMRAVSRRHEIVTRLALGASRARLLRLFLAEGALVSFGGGLLGVLLAAIAGPALLAVIPAGSLPRREEIHMDGWVLLFTLALSTITSLAVGALAAVHAGREDLLAVSRETTGSGSRGSHRIRHVLVVAELAVTLVLLVGAGLLARSFLHLRSVELGFQPGRVMTMTLDVPRSQYPTVVALREFHARVLDSLAASPGIVSVGAVNWLPLGDVLLRGDIRAEAGRHPGDDYTVTKAAVSPGYFATMGIKLSGREFTDADEAGAPQVAIVSEAVAQRIWPNQDAIGKRISIETTPKPEDWLTIVGIAADIRQSGLKEPVVPALYQPYRQVSRAGFLSRMTFVARAAGAPRDVAPMMRTALRSVDPNQAPQAMASMDAVLAQTIVEPQFHTRLIAIFSALALVLAAVGIYGVLAAAVAERQREIGIRMALGADRATVVRLILRRTLLLTAFGVGLGILGASAATKLLATLLFNVTPTDPAAFLGAVSVLVVAALLAGLLPARKASRVDPLVALRTL